MHVTVAHRVGDTIYPFFEVVGTASQETAHLVDFFPVPLALLLVFPELPHFLPAPAGSGRRCMDRTV
jgi:hypothetical protein